MEHGAAVRAVAISRDGSVVATAGADGFVRVWQAREAKLLHALNNGAPLTKVLFAADGYQYAGKTLDCLPTIRGVKEKIPSIKRIVLVRNLREPAADELPRAFAPIPRRRPGCAPRRR